ncbi:MAG TPA: SRPBCC family protein [Actinomycetota bacterium]|nr:SRPBCC family protein [Actinomycetota bacterium]
MPSPYVVDYRGTFEIPLPTEESWSLLQATERYEKWWPWMRDLRIDGDGLARDSTFSFRVVSPLPYRMRLRVSVTEVAERGATATIDGDLKGSGGIELDETGSGTSVTLRWRVEVVHPQMRVAARIARPVLRWGQTWAIQAALRGFLRDVRGRD